MPKLCGTYNPFRDKSGFLVAIFYDDEGFYIQESDDGKEVEKFRPIKIKADRLNTGFQLISNGSNSNKPLYAFQKLNNEILVGFYSDMKAKLKHEIHEPYGVSVLLDISEFIEDKTSLMYYEHCDEYQEENGVEFDFQKATIVDKGIDDFEKTIENEEIELEVLDMS